jgi:ATP-dependent DNA helicase RecQ
MPSRRRPIFVESLARGIANVGRLPFAGTLAWRGGPPSGSPGGNSAFRLASVWERFSVEGLDLPGGVPVLLVDDVIDSRWTVTVAGQALLGAGASAVMPFAAALRS